MNIWIGSEADCLAAAPEFNLREDVTCTEDDVYRIVMEINAAPVRASRSGLARLVALRRQSNAAGVLAYSFESRRTFAERSSMMQEGVPGVVFLRAPFSVETLRATLATLKPLTPGELAYVRRWHCGLQEDWRRIAHDLGHLLRDWPATRAKVEAQVRSIGGDIRALAPDQAPALDALLQAMQEPEEEVRAALQALDMGLCRGNLSLPPPPAPFARPPAGFDSIAVADDSGYEVAAIAAMKQRGYTVFPVARTLEAALRQLERASPRVALADRHFPSAQEGRRYMEAALQREWVRVVIAISRSAVDAAALPEGVEDCTGAENFQDAERIHRLIWRRARVEGVERHV